MKRWCIVLGGLAALMLFVLTVSVYQIAHWSEWANRVWIVGQKETTKEAVEGILGAPESVLKPSAVDMGFTPRPVVPPGAVKVYVYSRHYPFMQPAEYWEAVVFIDKNGRVAGANFGHS